MRIFCGTQPIEVSYRKVTAYSERFRSELNMYTAPPYRALHAI